MPIHSMFDQCRKVFCRYQTYPIENHLKEKEAYQSLDNTKLSWWFRRDMNHGPSGCDDTIDISEYDAYYLDQNASKKNEKVVYLTFDCGYENGYTEQMLDILKKEDVPACFFVTQTYIRDNVAIAKRMKEMKDIRWEIIPSTIYACRISPMRRLCRRSMVARII